MNEKKRVLIVAYDGMNKSGVPGVIIEIINGLHDKYQFSIATFQNIDDDYYYQDLKKMGVNIFTIPKKQLSNPLSKIWYETRGYHSYLEKEFLQIFKDNRFDIVHSFKESDSSGILSAAKKAGIEKRIIHTTVLHNSKDIWGFISKGKMKKSVKYSTDLVGGSKLSCELAFKNKNYSVITNCYKSEIFKYIENGPFERLELIQVGYYSPNKNQIFSLNVVKKLKEHYHDVLIHFFGNNNDINYYNQFLDNINQLGLKDNVVIHQGNDDQLECYKNVSYALVPSIREGFALILLEAQACGVRCVASNGVPKDADAGGVKFLELEAEKWANYIDKDFKENSGKHTVYKMEDFSKESFLKKIEKLYSE